MIPQTLPSFPTTGRQLIRRDSISEAAAERGVSGVTVNTLCVITPLTFLACQLGVRSSARKHFLPQNQRVVFEIPEFIRARVTA